MENKRHLLTYPFDFAGQKIKDVGFNNLKVSDRLTIAEYVDKLPDSASLVADHHFTINCLSVITGLDPLAFDDMSDADFNEVKDIAAPFMPKGWASMLHSSAA